MSETDLSILPPVPYMERFEGQQVCSVVRKISQRK